MASDEEPRPPQRQGGNRRAGTVRSLPRAPRQSASAPPPPDLEIERRRVRAAACAFTKDRDGAHHYLADEAALVRAAALAALVALADLAPTEREQAVIDPAPEVRRTLAELAVKAGLAHCGALVRDDDPAVVEAACFAAGEIGDRDALGALIEISTHHADPLCRESAVAALGALGAPEGLPAVLAALDDRPEVRRRAVVALSAFAGEQVTEALRARLSDRDWQVRQAAEDVLSLSEPTPS